MDFDQELKVRDFLGAYGKRLREGEDIDSLIEEASENGMQGIYKDAVMKVRYDQARLNPDYAQSLNNKASTVDTSNDLTKPILERIQRELANQEKFRGNARVDSTTGRISLQGNSDYDTGRQETLSGFNPPWSSSHTEEDDIEQNKIRANAIFNPNAMRGIEANIEDHIDDIGEKNEAGEITAINTDKVEDLALGYSKEYDNRLAKIIEALKVGTDFKFKQMDPTNKDKIIDPSLIKQKQEEITKSNQIASEEIEKFNTRFNAMVTLDHAKTAASLQTFNENNLANEKTTKHQVEESKGLAFLETGNFKLARPNIGSDVTTRMIEQEINPKEFDKLRNDPRSEGMSDAQLRAVYDQSRTGDKSMTSESLFEQLEKNISNSHQLHKDGKVFVKDVLGEHQNNNPRDDSYLTSIFDKVKGQFSEVSGDVKDNLSEVFEKIKETFDLTRDNIKASMDAIADYTIDSKQKIDDLFKKGGLSDIDLKEQIKELDKQILEAQAVNSSTMDSMSFLSNIKTDSFGTETFDSFVNSITNTGSEEQNATTLVEKINNMTNNMNAKQNMASQLQTSITNSEKLNNLKMSTGGFVSGPMGKDVIPAMLTDGEFVIRADVAKNWRGFLEHLNSKGHLGLHHGGPVMLADGGAPGGGGGSGGSGGFGGSGVPPGSPGGGGGGGGGIPSIESQQVDLLKYNSELMSQERIYTELVMYSKELAESGESAVSIQEKLNAKKEILLNLLREEEELSHATLRELQEQKALLITMDNFKLSGFYDGLIGTFDVVEQKIEGILDSVPFVGSLLATSLKTVTGPAFDELRRGFKTGFTTALDELTEQMGVSVDGSLNPFDPDKLEVDKLMDAFTGQFSQAMTNAKNMLEGAIGLAKAFGPALLTVALPLVIIGGLLAAAVSRFFKVEELTHDFRKELGLSAKVTKNLERETVKVQRSLSGYGVSLEEAFDSAKALTEILGSTAMVTEKNIKLVALLENGMGIASLTGAQVYETFKLISGGSSEIATNLSYVTSELAAAAGVPLGRVMEDIAGASDSVYAFVRGSGKELAVAAVEARRLGTNIEEIAGSMESMLDFESSITKEMKMATMLGRHINLDSLRRASYEGDMVKYMAEESKILEGIGDLTKMNSYERKAVSEALGKDVKTLMKQQQHMKQIEAMRNGTVEQQKMAAKYDEARRMALEGETKSLAEQGMERLKAEDNANIRNKLANQFNRLLDELGSVLLPVVETSMNILIPILDHLISGFGYLIKIVEFLLQPFIFIFNTLSAIGSITGLWEGSLDGLKSQFDGLGASLFAIGGILLSFTSVGKQMIANLTGLFKPITGLIDKGFGLLFKNITGTFGNVMKSASEIVSDGTEGIFMTFTNNAKKIGPFLKDGFLKGIDGLKKLGPSFSSFISNSMGGIKSLGGALLGAFKEPGKAINTLKSSVTTLFTSGLEGSKTLGKSLLNAFKNPRATLSSLFGALSGFFSSGMKGAKGLKDSLVGAFKGGGEGGGIKGMASKVKDMFGPASVRGLKKDGTPDMRFKENKIKAAEQANTTKVGASDKSKDVSKSTKGGKKGASGFDKFVKSFNKIDMKQVLKGAAALAILSGALYIAGKAFQQFSKVDWAGVAKGATGLAVMIGGLWAMSKFIDKAGSSLIKGAVAIALLGASLLPAAFAFQMFGDVSWGDVIYGAVALGVLTAAAFGLSLIAVPVAIGAGVLALLGAALIPLAYALNIATPALEAFGGVINSMGSAISGIIDSMFGGLSKLAELDGVKLLGVAGGLTAVGAAMVALGAGQGIGAFLSMFASDDPFSVYIRLGDNAEKINTGADSLRNVAGAISELSKNDAEDILDDLGDGFEDLFDEIEDIDDDAITRFVSVGTSFKGIGEGMTALDKGVAPMSQLLTLLGNPDIYAVAVSGLDAMTQSILKFTEALEELGTFGTILMGIMTAGGGIPKPTTEVVNQTTGEEPQKIRM